MTLRRTLLLLFLALAVAPLCALGLFNHMQTMRGLEALLVRQTQTLADRAGQEIAGRLAVQRSDLLLLARNVDTRQLLDAHARGDSAAVQAARRTAEPFLQQLWLQYEPWYRSIELLDARGAVVFRLGDEPMHSDEEWGLPSDELHFSEPVPGGIGEVVAHTRLDAMLPPEALEPSFGERGYTMVVDRGRERLLYHPDGARLRQPLDSALSSQLSELPAVDRKILRWGQGDSLQLASYAVLANVPWAVLTTASLSEFAPPFARVRTTSLLALLFVTLSVFIAFAAATRRATGRLHELTRAADAVGRGDFAPALPPAGADEVGRLTAAFALMTSQVSEMMRQMQRGRQMAAIGAFSAEIAHEIRNPLTSVKLNLQRIERLVARGAVPQEAAAALDIALREIERLERVVRGVLHLGNPRPLTRVHCSLHDVILCALQNLEVPEGGTAVRIDTRLHALEDTVLGDAGQLQGALLNVLQNAMQAMPDGGTLSVETGLAVTDGADVIAVRIADTGPGIPADVRSRLFQPFFSTRPEGTGLGLVIALRTAEEHGGTLGIEESDAGALFRLVLPLSRPEVLQ